MLLRVTSLFATGRNTEYLHLFSQIASSQSQKMSADTIRKAYKYTCNMVRPQMYSEKSLMESVVDFFSDVVPQAYSGSQRCEDKEKIQWVRFETCDCNDVAKNPDLFRSDTKGLPLLLILGYSNGVQIWHLTPNGEAQEVLSLRQGPVRVCRILPNPEPVLGSADSFSSKRPLAIMCDSSSAGQPYCGVKLVSLKTGDEVHSISFKTLPVQNIECNKRFIVLVFLEKICVHEACNFKQLFWVTSCFPCPGPNVNPVALSARWLAYADKRLVAMHQSCGGMSGDGSQSYAATVISAAKGAFKGLSMFGEAMVSSVTGTKQGPVKRDLVQLDNGNRPGIVTVIDIQNIHNDHFNVNEDNEGDGLIAHFHAHANEPVSNMAFDPTGTLLVTSCKLGHNFHVFRLMAHPVSSSLGAVHHLYTLHRGDTTAKVIDISFNHDSRWVTVSSHRGTTHLFPITPYGGSVNVRTHCQPHVVNRASRFHRSAGIDEFEHVGRRSPILSTSPGSSGQYDRYPSLIQQNTLNNNMGNPRLPPYPHPITIYPAYQVKQPLNVVLNPHNKNASPSHSPTGVDNVYCVCAKFCTPRLCVIGSPKLDMERRDASKRPVDSLFVMAQSGTLVEYVLEPRAKAVSDKVTDDCMLELNVQGRMQWNLQRLKNSTEMRPPLPSNSPLILAHEAVVSQTPTAPDLYDLPGLTRQDSKDSLSSDHSNKDDNDEQWVSHVEIITHAGPHRRLWMGPQFCFKTYQEHTTVLCSNSSALLSQSPESNMTPMDMAGDEGDLESLKLQPTRSNPVSMPNARPAYRRLSGSDSSPSPGQGVSTQAGPLLIEAGSFDQSPHLLDVFSNWTESSVAKQPRGSEDLEEDRLKETLADAMVESPHKDIEKLSLRQQDIARPSVRRATEQQEPIRMERMSEVPMATKELESPKKAVTGKERVKREKEEVKDTEKVTVQDGLTEPKLSEHSKTNIQKEKTVKEALSADNTSQAGKSKKGAVVKDVSDDKEQATSKDRTDKVVKSNSRDNAGGLEKSDFDKSDNNSCQSPSVEKPKSQGRKGKNGRKANSGNIDVANSKEISEQAKEKSAELHVSCVEKVDNVELMVKETSLKPEETTGNIEHEPSSNSSRTVHKTVDIPEMDHNLTVESQSNIAAKESDLTMSQINDVTRAGSSSPKGKSKKSAKKKSKKSGERNDVVDSSPIKSANSNKKEVSKDETTEGTTSPVRNVPVTKDGNGNCLNTPKDPVTEAPVKDRSLPDKVNTPEDECLGTALIETEKDFQSETETVNVQLDEDCGPQMQESIEILLPDHTVEDIDNTVLEEAILDRSEKAVNHANDKHEKETTNTHANVWEDSSSKKSKRKNKRKGGHAEGMASSVIGQQVATEEKPVNEPRLEECLPETLETPIEDRAIEEQTVVIEHEIAAEIDNKLITESHTDVKPETVAMDIESTNHCIEVNKELLEEAAVDEVDFIPVGDEHDKQTKQDVTQETGMSDFAPVKGKKKNKGKKHDTLVSASEDTLVTEDKPQQEDTSVAENKSEPSKSEKPKGNCEKPEKSGIAKDDKVSTENVKKVAKECNIKNEEIVSQENNKVKGTGTGGVKESNEEGEDEKGATGNTAEEITCEKKAIVEEDAAVEEMFEKKSKRRKKKKKNLMEESVYFVEPVKQQSSSCDMSVQEPETISIERDESTTESSEAHEAGDDKLNVPEQIDSELIAQDNVTYQSMEKEKEECTKQLESGIEDVNFNECKAEPLSHANEKVECMKEGTVAEALKDDEFSFTVSKKKGKKKKKGVDSKTTAQSYFDETVNHNVESEVIVNQPTSERDFKQHETENKSKKPVPEEKVRCETFETKVCKDGKGKEEDLEVIQVISEESVLDSEKGEMSDSLDKDEAFEEARESRGGDSEGDSRYETADDDPTAWERACGADSSDVSKSNSESSDLFRVDRGRSSGFDVKHGDSVDTVASVVEVEEEISKMTLISKSESRDMDSRGLGRESSEEKEENKGASFETKVKVAPTSSLYAESCSGSNRSSEEKEMGGAQKMDAKKQESKSKKKKKKNRK